MKPNGFRTILVVEDDEAVRKFSLLVLRTHGYRTLESFDGVGGLATFLRHKDEVDLVLTDLVMPHSGSEMVEKILRLEPTVKVVFMTGTAGHSELPRHLKDVPIIEKPFTARQLADLVRQHL